jgi:uncharacterized membrane protein YidH (DUF202 family)
MATGGPPADTATAERTALAWTRTSFAFLANGALLMIRNLHGHVGPTALIPAFLAATVALGTYLIALRRQRILQQPIPTRIIPRRQVYVIGTAVLVLIVVTTVAQLI